MEEIDHFACSLEICIIVCRGLHNVMLADCLHLLHELRYGLHHVECKHTLIVKENLVIVIGEEIYNAIKY